MELKWTGKALSDFAQLHDFLEPNNSVAAAHTIQSLNRAPMTLLRNPRVGEQLFQFEPREVRCILINRYELRYGIVGEVIYLLRLWHTREDR